ncbi:MAG: endonuclease/exonuclease/phosphatase family protein [Patescibacteria group bacterium]
MHNFSVITYNVRFNHALCDVPQIIKDHSPDVICLQEVALGKKHSYRELFPGYTLAATSNSFYRIGKTYGQANFYKTEKFYQVGSRGIYLPKTYYEVLLTTFTRKGPRTALCTDLIFRDTFKTVSICNLHLTALVATNSARNKQLSEALDELDFMPDEPVVVLGDFNYPFRKRGLEKVMVEYGLSEATSNLTYTYTPLMKFIKERLKFDFVLYRCLQKAQSTLLDDYKKSDHYPVLTTFEI